MYQLMADWGHPASLPSLLDMIYLPPHLPRIFNHGRRCDYAYAFHASADTVVTKILQQLKRSNTIELSTPAASPREGGGEYSWEFLVGVCRKVLQILTRFQTKKCNFPHPFSD